MLRGTLIDVRTQAEFAAGHVPGSINVPLNELPQQLSYIRNLTPPLRCCCAKGIRSETAVELLEAAGIAAINAGSWLQCMQKEEI